VLVVLGLSAWEIEMARFGRMYAPFQAIFLWYVYHAYKLAADGDLRRWRWLIGLSAIGLFVFEGAIILVLCNFLPLFLGNRYWAKRHLIASASVLLAALAYITTNFRYLGSAPFIAEDNGADTSAADGMFDELLQQIMPVLPQNTWAIVTLAALVGILLFFAFDVMRRNRSTASELVVILTLFITTVAGKLLLSLFVMFAAVALGWIGASSLRKPEIRNYAIATGIASLIIITITAFSDFAPTLTSRISVLIEFPDVLYTLVYPWLDALPVMSLFLSLALLVSFALLMFRGEQAATDFRLLFLILLVFIFIIAVAPTPYRETRYTFCLYPLLVCMCGYLVQALRVAGPGSRRRWLGRVFPVVLLAGFLLSEDFDFKHLVDIDGYDSNFRVGYSDTKQRHYYIRTDYASVADFVNREATAGDVIVATAVALTHYLDDTDFVFMSRDDRRAPGQICPDGRYERWTGIPLIGSVDEFSAVADQNDSRTWLVVDKHLAALPDWQDYLRASGNMESVFTSPDKRLEVYRSNFP